MLKLLNKWGIPNVVSHRLSEPVLNVMAFLYEKVVQKRNLIDVVECRNNARSNYFLSKQFKRMMRYAKNNELEKFNFLAIKLLNSYSFQVQAYNSVFPRWIQVGSHRRHLRYLRKLCQSRSVDLDYKRVWIDKKPGDYARPLGVPSLVWRVYLRMLTNLGEIFIQGRGLYSNFQHGGRPGKGVMTCLIEMVQKFEKYDSVYEFDLKGFFDHVSKDSVKEFFSGTILSEIYYQLLKVLPNKFQLPPREKDKAVIELEAYEAKYKTILKLLREVQDEYWEIINDTRGRIIWGTSSRSFPGSRNHRRLNDWALRYSMVLKEVRYLETDRENHNRDRRYAMREKALIYSGPGVLFDFESFDIPIDIKKYYRLLVENKKLTNIKGVNLRILPFNEKDRATGRDNWKDLNLVDQGIPQGSSFGPMIASTIVAYYLRSIPNLLMYVDDGMVFLPTGSVSPESIIKDALKPIKVELALEKSRMRDNLSLHKEGIKFLGTRSHLLTNVRNHMTMASETRKGTVRSFPVANRENFMTIIEKMYKEKMITISKFREMTLLKHRNSRLFEFLTGQSLNIAIKWGFFGNLLAECYDPSNDPKDIKRKIQEGMDKAYEAATVNKNSIGHFILKQERWVYIDNQTGKPNIVKPDLFNVSTLACDLLLELGVNDIRRPRVRLPKNKVRSFNGKSHY